MSLFRYAGISYETEAPATAAAHPLPVGFSVQEDLSVREVEVEGLPGYDPGADIREAIADAVLDIACERDGAATEVGIREFGVRVVIQGCAKRFGELRP